MQTQAEILTTAHKEEVVRDRLPHAWHAFFGRFGRLTGIQKYAAVPIASGRNVLVNAPTASGKTEALLGPLIERLLAADAKQASQRRGIRNRQVKAAMPLSVMVIAPTRALCNDLLRRLKRPLGAVGLSVDIKTGDSPGFNAEKPPRVLITTPESLDSLLVRRPKALRKVFGIVLDELHLLADTVRGDQLMALVERLDKITETPLQRCAASATVADAQRIAGLYLGANPAIANDPDAVQRPIIAQLEPADDLVQAVQPIAALYEEKPRRKIIVFCNTRSQVEALAGLMRLTPAFDRKVFAHHGSMSRQERLRVEKSFLEAPTAVCVATMTLELGIDIGDVDRIVLLAPPPDVASLLQRVGRGNRNEATTHVLCLYQGEFERIRFEHLLQCAMRGAIFPDPVAFRPTVVAQQSLSLLFQNPKGWVNLAALRGRLPAAATRLWSEEDCERILDALTLSPHYLRQIEGKRFVADEAAHKIYEYGRIHSLIGDSPETEVVDEMTGRVVGSVRVSKGDRERMDSGDSMSFSLGGRRHTAQRFAGDKLVASASDGVDRGQFIAREAPRYSLPLAQDFAEFLGLETDRFRVLSAGEKHWQLAHFQGTIRGHLMQEVLKKVGLEPAGKASPFFATIGQLPPHGEPLASEERLRGIVSGALQRVGTRVARALGIGTFRNILPEDLVHRWIMASVDIESFILHVAKTPVVLEEGV